jgi:hypothetical protein
VESWCIVFVILIVICSFISTLLRWQALVITSFRHLGICGPHSPLLTSSVPYIRLPKFAHHHFARVFCRRESRRGVVERPGHFEDDFSSYFKSDISMSEERLGHPFPEHLTTRVECCYDSYVLAGLAR